MDWRATHVLPIMAASLRRLGACVTSREDVERGVLWLCSRARCKCGITWHGDGLRLILRGPGHARKTLVRDIHDMISPSPFYVSTISFRRE